MFGQFPYCTDCTQFVKCYGAGGTLLTCQGGLQYDVSLGVCNYIGVAVCGYALSRVDAFAQKRCCGLLLYIDT